MTKNIRVKVGRLYLARISIFPLLFGSLEFCQLLMTHTTSGLPVGAHTSSVSVSDCLSRCLFHTDWMMLNNALLQMAHMGGETGTYWQSLVSRWIACLPSHMRFGSRAILILGWKSAWRWSGRKWAFHPWVSRKHRPRNADHRPQTSKTQTSKTQTLKTQTLK